MQTEAVVKFTLIDFNIKLKYSHSTNTIIFLVQSNLHYPK